MENAVKSDRHIIFADGYSVRVAADRLTVQSGMQRFACDPLFLDEIEENSNFFDRIKKAGHEPSEYLSDQIIFVRAGGGIRQAVQEIKNDKRREVAERRRRREQQLTIFFNQEIKLTGA